MSEINLRVTVKYFAGYPELEADLEKLPLRVRAERLRVLATVGLAVMRGERVLESGRTTSAPTGIDKSVVQSVDVTEASVNKQPVVECAKVAVNEMPKVNPKVVHGLMSQF